MATAVATKMTAAEFFDFVHRPENAGRFFELERGEVVEMPPPGKLHGFVCNILAWYLTNWSVQRGRGYVCTNDTGMIVENKPDTVRGADVSYYDDDRDADTIERGYAGAPPLLVVEVLSPNDKPGRVKRRVREYLKRGVGLVWIVDPEARSVAIHRGGAEPVALQEKDVLIGGPDLAGLRLKVADLFKAPADARGSTKRNGPRRGAAKRKREG